MNNNDILEFVSTIITNENKNVLLLKRSKDLQLDPGKYDLCSGHMKNGEIPMQTAIREISEELGIEYEKIIEIDKVGTIKTPHIRFRNTICHIYHVEINLSEEQINQNIKKMEHPEIEGVIFIKDIHTLRAVQKYTDLMRTEYTDELDRILKKVENRLNKKEEIKLCQKER